MAPTIRQVVINADDLGLTQSVSEGIFFAYDNGLISDFSLMANGEACDFAIRGLKERGILDVGMHFSVVDGEIPLDKSKGTAVLLDGARFPVSAKPFILLAKSFFMRGKIKKAIALEFEAQYRKIKETGLRISHLDSHQHVHLFWGIADILAKKCHENGIRFIRRPMTKSIDPAGILMRYLGSRLTRICRGKEVEVVSTYGYDTRNSNSSEIIQAYITAKSGEILREIAVHPGFQDEYSLRKYAHWRIKWDEELGVLRKLDMVKITERVKLVSYGELKTRLLACPGCGNDNHKVVFDLDSYKVIKCEDCTLMYNRDFLEQSNPEETFSADYYCQVQSEGFAHIFDDSKEDPSKPLYIKGLEYVETRSGVGSVLDVGCAFGAFLKVAKERSWRVEGVELSPYSSNQARTKFGLEVHTGDLFNTEVSKESYDLITFWDVLEHVTNVDNQLKRASELVKGGGHLVLVTDSYNGLIALVASCLFYLTFGRYKYPVKKFYIPYNSCYFVKRDMEKLLKNNGFKVVYTEGVDHPLERINLGKIERSVLRILYGMGDVLGLNSQFLMVAEKEIN